MERNLFATLANQIGDHHLIKNFVSGQPFVDVKGHSLSFLAPHNNVSTHDGNTQIGLHGGMTTIELQGVTTLKATDLISKH